MSETTDKRRRDDSFLRKVMSTLVAALIIQAIGWIYLLGSLVNQVDTNKKDIEKLQSLNDRLVRIEVKMDTALKKLERMEK